MGPVAPFVRVLCVLGLLAVSSAQNTTTQVSDGFDYGILIDAGELLCRGSQSPNTNDIFFELAAGSSGSRLTINRWPSRVFGISQIPPPFSVPIQVYTYGGRSSPGINLPVSGYPVVIAISYSIAALIPDNHTQDGRSLLPTMLAAAQARLVNQSARFSTFPVFLCATAGMRILNVSLQSSIMTEVRGILRQSPFLFRDAWASIISGEEEGVYGWISTNYQLGLLSNTTGLANRTKGVSRPKHCSYSCCRHCLVICRCPRLWRRLDSDHHGARVR